MKTSNCCMKERAHAGIDQLIESKQKEENQRTLWVALKERMPAHLVRKIIRIPGAQVIV